jgi:hypothetical protein
VKSLGKKAVWQQRFWSNPIKTNQVPNIKPDCYLPKSVTDTLIVADLYDVPGFEKPIMNSAITFGTKNYPNLIILNNNTNI